MIDNKKLMYYVDIPVDFLDFVNASVVDGY